MKLIRSLSILTAFAVIVPTAAFAAEKKAAKKEAAAPATPAAEAKKPAPAAEAKPAAEKAGKAGKALPMYARVDSIDPSTKSFIHKSKDGKETKHVLSASAEIKNGGAEAKFEDIKVGDTVSGLRVKKSDTEYEITKITKFGPAAPKEKGAKKAKEGDKPAEKKAEEKK
jgi:hypothetical protein